MPGAEAEELKRQANHAITTTATRHVAVAVSHEGVGCIPRIGWVGSSQYAGSCLGRLRQRRNVIWPARVGGPTISPNRTIDSSREPGSRWIAAEMAPASGCGVSGASFSTSGMQKVCTARSFARLLAPGTGGRPASRCHQRHPQA